MRTWLSLLACALVAACAGPQPLTQRPEHLFRDDLFAAPSERISAGDVFALSEPMHRYLRHEIAGQLRRKGPQQGLIDALYQKGELRLDYDASMTRNAAQAFEAKAGNCLSLVIMTAALARELGLQVRYQSAYLEEALSRSSNLVLRSGHVNVTLGRTLADTRGNAIHHSLTIDFLPAEELRGLRTREIAEQTVVAMFMNNRAVEALVGGRIDDAYAWAREAVRQDPSFVAAQNTLGVVYLRHGELPQAVAVFDHVLALEAQNKSAMSNLATTLARQGRIEESMAWYRRLAQLEPDPPFRFFDQGLAAMKQQDYKAAQDLFAREVGRADDYHEFHFWLGLASIKLGDHDKARRHLMQALETSTTPTDRALYAAKLDRLRAHGLR